MRPTTTTTATPPAMIPMSLPRLLPLSLLLVVVALGFDPGAVVAPPVVFAVRVPAAGLAFVLLVVLLVVPLPVLPGAAITLPPWLPLLSDSTKIVAG
jgi:hypothetical protein